MSNRRDYQHFIHLAQATSGQKGRIDEAIEIMQSTIDAVRPEDGPKPNALSWACSNVGYLFEKQGDFEQATEYDQYSEVSIWISTSSLFIFGASGRRISSCQSSKKPRSVSVL